MEQRITRAKARIAKAGVPFEAPGAPERAERLAAVAAMIYLVFNEGYSAPQRGGARRARSWPRKASGWCACCCACSRAEPEIMGLAALMLLQQARAAARFDGDGGIVLLEDQDRSRWNSQAHRRGPGADRQGDAPPPPRPLSGPGRDRRAACPRRARRGHRLGADRPALRHPRTAAAFAGGHAQPRRRGRQGARPGGGAGDDRAARRAARRLLLLPRRARAPCCSSSAAATRRARPSTGRSRLANTPAEAAHIRQHLDHLRQGERSSRLGQQK